MPNLSLYPRKIAPPNSLGHAAGPLLLALLRRTEPLRIVVVQDIAVRGRARRDAVGHIPLRLRLQVAPPSRRGRVGGRRCCRGGPGRCRGRESAAAGSLGDRGGEAAGDGVHGVS